MRASERGRRASEQGARARDLERVRWRKIGIVLASELGSAGVEAGMRGHAVASRGGPGERVEARGG